jgi:hypothetical protein
MNGARIACTVTALAAALAGCGEGSSPPTTAQVAKEIGAVAEHPYAKGPFASGAVVARWHGQQVVIAVFPDGARQREYIKIVSAIEGPPCSAVPATWSVRTGCRERPAGRQVPS